MQRLLLACLVACMVGIGLGQDWEGSVQEKVMRSCTNEDGSLETFSCPERSNYCFDNSELYCHHGQSHVAEVKKILEAQDNEIDSLKRKIAELKARDAAAASKTAKLKKDIEESLYFASKRRYILTPKLLKGHYVATDNAIILVSCAASVGVLLGIIGRSYGSLFSAGGGKLKSPSKMN